MENTLNNLIFADDGLMNYSRWFCNQYIKKARKLFWKVDDGDEVDDSDGDGDDGDDDDDDDDDITTIVPSWQQLSGHI